MNRQIGIGVVGAGSIGIRGALEHLYLSDVADKVTLAAVCDPVPGRAQAAAEKYGVAKAYVDYEELLANPAVDAVTLGSPIGLHYEQGLSAIRAGKHIHFNKTMTTTLREAKHLIEEAAARNVKLVASPGQMTRPYNRAIRDLISSGELGRLCWAKVGAAFGTYHENEAGRHGQDVLSDVNPAWYWRKPGGGPLYDMTVYGLHTLTGILGPAKRVTAMSGLALPVRLFRGKEYPVDADDNTVGLLDFGNSLFAFVYGTAAGGINREFGQPDFYGTDGALIGTTLRGQPLTYPGSDPGPGRSTLGPHVVGRHSEMDEAHVFEDIMQLVDWVRDGVAPFGTAEHAAHVIDIIEAMYRAAETGTTQTLTTTFTAT
jgi:predicted dehydrogenase